MSLFSEFTLNNHIKSGYMPSLQVATQLMGAQSKTQDVAESGPATSNTQMNLMHFINDLPM